MEKVFFKKSQIYFYDCDYKKRAKLSTINKLFSEIAGEAYAQTGMTHQYLLEKGYAFLLSKISIAFKRLPEESEIVTVATWERGNKGASFIRDFEMFDEEEKLICDAHSEWIVVNPQTRQIIRPSLFDGPRILLPDREASAPDCKRLKLSEGTEVEKRSIRYSDIDGNGHVYNAFYADFVVDALPPKLREKDIKFYQMNFIHELKLDDELLLTMLEEKEKVIVKGASEEKESFVCEICY